jgi:hypothetical protein
MCLWTIVARLQARTRGKEVSNHCGRKVSYVQGKEIRQKKKKKKEKKTRTQYGAEYSQAPATPISNILPFSSLPFTSSTEIHTTYYACSFSYLHEILLIFPEMMYVVYSYARKVGHHAVV